MIERRVIEDRVAILVFMDSDYKVVDLKQATQAKVIFDDGEIAWLTVEDYDLVEDCETIDDFLERMEGYWPGA